MRETEEQHGLRIKTKTPLSEVYVFLKDKVGVLFIPVFQNQAYCFYLVVNLVCMAK